MTGDGESVGDAAQRVDGCLPQNSAEDVLDVMAALHLNFMPLVEDFESRRLLGIVARDELARILEWNGGSGRAGDAELIELPTVRADTLLSDIADGAKQHCAWLVVDLQGRVHGIYECSDLAGHEEPWQE
jgi:CBS-domain-containing membrane protein